MNKLVKGLDPDGNETPNWDLNVLAGAGGILSSVAEPVPICASTIHWFQPSIGIDQKTYL